MALKFKYRFQLFAYKTLVCFWSLVVFLKLLKEWFCNFGNYFYVLPHKKPVVKENWEHGRLKVNDIKIHYVECGSKNDPLMLFVHGFCDFYYGWRHQLDYFGQQSYRVVAIDMRGYNDSSKPEPVDSYKVQYLVADLREVINHLGNGKATLVADDIGAFVCWLLAEEQPEMVEQMVMINCPVPRAYLHLVCTNSRQLLAAWHWFAMQSPYLAEFMFQAQDYNGVVRLFRSSIKNKHNFSDLDADYYKYVFSKKHGLTAPLQFFRAISCLFDDNYELSNKLIKPRTLIIWGANNDMLVIDGAYHSKAYCEQAVLKVISGSRHLQIDKPQLINQLIDDFLVLNKTNLQVVWSFIRKFITSSGLKQLRVSPNFAIYFVFTINDSNREPQFFELKPKVSVFWNGQNMSALVAAISSLNDRELDNYVQICFPAFISAGN